jgi:deoxyribonuclease V
MIACLDVDYRDDAAFAAGIVFGDWPDANPLDEKIVRVTGIPPYQSGKFFRRELPCLLSILKVLPSVGVIIIDGYVWLDGKAGLGAYLHRALEGRVTVIGVAKTKFRRASAARVVRRGCSTRPLFITAAGMSAEQAAECICSMHGPHRIPALLQRVDRLCRRAAIESI